LFTYALIELIAGKDRDALLKLFDGYHKITKEKFAEELINNKEEIRSGQGASRDRVQTIMIIIIIAVILIIIIGSIINRSKYGRSRGWSGYYGGGGFHGGGGGGGGFGGGGFGGGGAGR
jgi:hypothetical protein